MSSVDHNRYRERVTAIYKQYNPAKLDTVDSVMEKYKGSEDALLEALVKRYGPEPSGETPAGLASPRADPASPTADPNRYRERVTAMYKQYNPAKLDTVDSVMEKYKGSEDALLEALVKRYGPEPSGETPAGLASSSGSGEMTVSVSREEMIADSAATDSASVPESSAAVAVEVTRSTSNDLPPASNESSLGPSPVAADKEKASRRASLAGRRRGLSLAERVRGMYLQYMPDKASQADKMLEKYEGNELRLLEALCNRYGDEPVADVKSPELLQLEASEHSSRKEVEGEAQLEGGLFPEIAAWLLSQQKVYLDSVEELQREEALQRGYIDESAVEGFSRLPPFPIDALTTQRNVVEAFFSCVGLNSKGLLERDAFDLLCSPIELSPSAAHCAFPASFEEFEAALVSQCHDSTKMIAKMEQFLDKVRRSQLAGGADGSGQPPPATKKKTTSALEAFDTSLGFWAHRCVFPTVLEHWGRVWVVCDKERRQLTWTAPNSTKLQGCIPSQNMLDVRLTALSGAAPRKFAKNGVSIQLTSGANPLIVCLCPEDVLHAHALVKTIRSWRRQTTTRCDPRPVQPTSEAVVHVWMCRSGFTTFTRKEWYLKEGKLWHRKDESDSNPGSWSVDDICDVTPSSLAGHNAPQRFRSFGFVLRLPKANLFCCAESSEDQNHLIQEIKKMKFRSFLASNKT